MKEVTTLITPLMVPNLAPNRRLLGQTNINKHICNKTHGFTIDVELDKWRNATNILSNKPVNEYRTRVNQMTYHDLRSPEELARNPLDFGCLLGLGHKFCIQESMPKREALVSTFERFDRDVRLKYTFACEEINTNYLAMKQRTF